MFHYNCGFFSAPGTDTIPTHQMHAQTPGQEKSYILFEDRQRLAPPLGHTEYYSSSGGKRGRPPRPIKKTPEEKGFWKPRLKICDTRFLRFSCVSARPDSQGNLCLALSIPVKPPTVSLVEARIRSDD